MIQKITKLSLKSLCGQVSPIIKLIVNTQNSEVFWIPLSVEIEHIQAMAEILKGKVRNFNDIIKQPQLAAHLVPVTFEVSDGVIYRMNVGASSAKRFYHVDSTLAALEKARDIALLLLKEGELQWKAPYIDMEPCHPIA